MTGKVCNPLVSVIVPVYNVAPYLDECIASICKQSYKNLEILVVDDGSNDGSGALCDRWEQRDSRITVFHKENGGLSDARNYALDRITGCYVTFVDSDDSISPNLVAYLLHLKNDLHAGISICDPVHCFPHMQWSYASENKRQLFNRDDAICELLYQRSFLVSAWGKLFDASCFSGIRFPKNKFFEDSAVMYRVFEETSRIAYGNARLYAYKHRTDSITSSQFGIRDLDMWEICKEIEEYYSSNRRMKPAVRSYRFSSALRIVLNAPSDGRFDDVITDCFQWAKENARKVMRDKNARKKSRLAAALFCYAPSLVQPIYKKVERWS